jgi:hypothetical protein
VKRRALPPLIHCSIHEAPLGKRALMFDGSGRYSGWTGFEGFGVITQYRYYGWAVTCDACVMAEAYDQGGVTLCFDHFEDAVRALFCLMDLAHEIGDLQALRKSMGVKRGQRVPYWKPPKEWDRGEGSLLWWRRGGLETIHDDFKTNPRAFWSRASTHHFQKRYNETPMDDKTMGWYAPRPIMGWHGNKEEDRLWLDK